MTDQETAETPPEGEGHQGFSPKVLFLVFLLVAVPVLLALLISVGGGDRKDPPEVAEAVELPRDALVRLRPEPISRPESQPDIPASPQDGDPIQETTQLPAVRPESLPQAAAPVRPEIAALQPQLEIELFTPRGSEPVYNVDEKLELTVTLSKSAYVYCYYQDAGGSIARIFPNRFRPDSFVQVDAPLQIPGIDSRFDIVFEISGGLEAIGCYASEQDIDTRLPETLQQDLTPLPVSSLEQVAAGLAQQGTINIARALLQIRVN